ncbi:hypothetical protein GQ457_02G029480 [Hibiscus cannabinus]
MTSKLCYGTGKLGFPSLLLSRVMSISVTLSELKSWLYTDDRILITCAGDGQVRQARILECGVKTRLLAKHQGNAYDMAYSYLENNSIRNDERKWKRGTLPC